MDSGAEMEIALAHAERVLGDRIRAGMWMSFPCSYLEGETPSSLIGRAGGLERIIAALARVEKELRNF